MSLFLQRHASDVICSLKGWDRVRFRGTVRMLANPRGLGRVMSSAKVLLKQFKEYVIQTSTSVKEGSLGLAEAAGRPVEFLSGSKVCKEDRAMEYARRDGISDGLICTLASVEPCWSFDLRSNPDNKRLYLDHAYRKCQHLYHYFMHPVFGLMHARLQTWLPFNIHICINGREWLGRQMDSAGIEYVRRDNCFAWVSDADAAQQLLDEQVKHDYTATLGKLAATVNPALRSIVGDWDVDYYWSVDESEWANDILFKDQQTLDRLTASLLRHGMGSFASPDVLRFLGHRTLAKGTIPPALKMEVLSDVKARPEGMRIKHRAGANSVKMYNKQGTVLRTEATLNNMRQLKAPRTGPDGKVIWRQMRKGVADIQRRAKISSDITERYLNQMAVADTPVPLKTLTDPVCKPVITNGRRHRAMDLLGKDAQLLTAISRGSLLIHGMTNRDLRQILHPNAAESEAKTLSGRITRQLSLLRAHGLIRKVPRTNRYMLTDIGRSLTTAIIAATSSDIHKLQNAA